MSTTWLEGHEAARQLFPLTGFGDTPALLAGGRVVTYAELDERVRERVDALGPVRRLMLLTGGNDVETVVSYLAALRGRHPLVLASPDAVGSHAAAGLGDVAQGRQVPVGEAAGVEQLERVGHSGERRGLRVAEPGPETFVRDRRVGQQQARPDGEAA